MVVCLRRVPEIKERLAFIAILGPRPSHSSSAGRGTGRESGWGGCEVTRGRGREVHYGSKVKAMGVFFLSRVRILDSV